MCSARTVSSSRPAPSVGSCGGPRAVRLCAQTITVSVAVAWLLAWGSGCSRSAAVETGRVARVERARIERLVVATGTVEPETEVEVRPRISGIVEQVHVAAGDRVVAGQALVEIE